MIPVGTFIHLLCLGHIFYELFLVQFSPFSAGLAFSCRPISSMLHIFLSTFRKLLFSDKEEVSFSSNVKKFNQTSLPLTSEPLLGKKAQGMFIIWVNKKLLQLFEEPGQLIILFKVFFSFDKVEKLSCMN